MSIMVGGPKLTCISCRKKRKLEVQLTAYQLNSSLGIFMCTTNECLYPLNTKNLHKFVYKVNSDGVYENCDPSEVPSLKDLFTLLSANAVTSDTTQSEKPLSSSSTCSEKPVSLSSSSQSEKPLSLSSSSQSEKPLSLSSSSQSEKPLSSSSSTQNEKPVSLSSKGSGAPCELSVKEGKVENELVLQSKNEEVIPKEISNDSVSYGVKFGTSNKANVFPIWENKDALCWLDSTLCLLVHSKTLKSYFKSERSGDCQLKDISIAYDEAVSVLNSERRSTRATRLPSVPFANLEKVRERTFKFLQPFQGCEKGQEDSPVFAIMLLLKQNKYLHGMFLLHFSLELKCNSCGYTKVTNYRKSLVTIPGILQNFSENHLSYPRPCFRCQKPNQKITLEFQKLPPVLLMHFVEGLPHSNISLYDLVFADQGYCVRGFVQYREPERHFITWVRDNTGDQWMCCDDLNPPVQRFKAKLPDIPSNEIHIVMWEHKETHFKDSFHLHYSGDEYYNESLSSIESVSPPLIILDDSDSEVEASRLQKSIKPSSIIKDQVIHTNDIKTCGKRSVSTPADRQPEDMVNDSLSFSLSCNLLSPYRNMSSISKNLNDVDKSVVPDLRQVPCEDSVMHNSSDGRAKEIWPKKQEQGPHIENNSAVLQKANAAHGAYGDEGHSEGDLISGNVPNQNVRASQSYPSLTNKSNFFQPSIGNGKQEKDLNCVSSVLNNMSKSDDKSVLNLPAPKLSLVPSNENQKPESSVCMTSTRSRVVGKDERDKSLPVCYAENEHCLNTQLERCTDSVGSYVILEKNQENKLDLEEHRSPLSRKRSRGQKKVCAENQSSEIRQNVKQKIVHDESGMSKDVKDKSLPVHYAENEHCLNTELEVTDSVGSYDIHEKNQENKHNLEERRSPLTRKRNRSCAVGKKKVHAENQSREIVQETVHEESDSSKDVQDKNLPVHYEENEHCLEKELESGMDSVGSYDVHKKNQESKLDLEEHRSPLTRKRNRSCAVGKKKVHAENQSEIVQETVHEESDSSKDVQDKELESGMDSVGSYDVHKKNQESKLDLQEHRSPLTRKRNRPCAVGKKRAHAENQSSEIEETVREESDSNKDVRDKSLPVHCAENEHCLDKELESGMDSVGSYDVHKKNQESKLDLLEHRSPLTRKRNRLCALGKKKAHAENQSSEIVQETVHEKSDSSKDVQNKSLPVHYAENEHCVNKELESGMDSVGSYDFHGKNEENELNLEEHRSPLTRKRNRSCAVGQKKVCAKNQSRQNAKQETVHDESDTSLDYYYAEMLCKSIRDCYIILDRSEVELYTKKTVLKQNTVQSARPCLRKDKCAQITTECIASSSAPSKQKEKGRRRKAAYLLKQSSFDAGLQDTNNIVEDGKVQAVHESGGSCSSSTVSVSVVPNEKFAKKQENELLKSPVVELSAPGHASECSSNLSVPEARTTVFPNKFSGKREQQHLAETSQKMSFEEQQIVILQNDSHGLSSESSSMKQSGKNVMKGDFEETCEAVQKDKKKENSGNFHNELCEKNNAPSEVSVMSQPFTELSVNQGLSTQASSCPNSHSAHSMSPTKLDTSNKTLSMCGSPFFNLESKKKLTDLPKDINPKIISSSEVLKNDISTVIESKESEVRSISCGEDCTCELCSVRRFLHSYEHTKLKLPGVSSNDKVLEKTNEISDASMGLGSSGASTSVAEHGLDSTVIVQNRNTISTIKNRSAKVCAKDSFVMDKSDHKVTRSKVPSRKCAVSKMNQSTMDRKKTSKNTTDKLEIFQEQIDLHKDLNVIQVSEGNYGDVTITKIETSIPKPPHVLRSCEHNEQKRAVSPIKKQKPTVKTGSVSVSTSYVLESSIEENSGPPVSMTLLPVEQKEVCESVEKPVTEEINKRVTYKHFGRQSKLCIRNTVDNEKAEIQHEKSNPCANSSISKKGKRQQCPDGTATTLTVPDTAVPKKQKRKCVSSELNSIEEGCTFLSDDSIAPKRKVERKFEPDSIKFVEVDVDTQSSDAESTGDERRCSEVPQAVAVELKSLFTKKRTSSVSGTKEKSPSCVIKYGGITAVFEPVVEDDVLEFSGSPTKQIDFSLNGISTSHPSQCDTSNVNVPSCEPGNQDIVAVSDSLLINAVESSPPVFDSVDLLRAHLCSELHNSTEQTGSVKECVALGSNNNVGQQSDVPYSEDKKLQVVQIKSKRGRKKKVDLQVLDSERTAQKSSKQNKRGRKKLSCDTAVSGQTEMPKEVSTCLTRQIGCESSTNIVKKDKDYLSAVKKIIYKHNVKSGENKNEICVSSDLSTPSESPLENKEITVNTEAEKKALSPACQIQDHSDTTSGILTEGKGRKKSKSVRFSIEPADGILKSKPGRKKVKGTSSGESKTSVLQGTVCEKAGKKSVAVFREVNVKKRSGVVGMPVAPRKKAKSEPSVSSVQNVDCDGSENRDGKPDIKPAGKVKPGILSQEARPVVSKTLNVVNPFLYFQKNLSLDYSSVSVPRPQVLRMSAPSH